MKPKQNSTNRSVRKWSIMNKELFDKFKKARSNAIHNLDTSNRECLILGQTNKMFNNEIEKLLQKVEIHQKNSNAHNAEMLKMQTKNSVNTLKINDYLNQIGILKKKLEEGQSNAAEMEPL
ncbi:hypothetical protein DVH24_021541 [Malus domestica]|uniref:Uncharacterized protein n=1 Tax=Malus domestica TaxID=3750 RepID=A0A498JV23_MALDO|nr:hypothetical protein DVH24_021541 [Malus domestica]